MKLQIKTLVTTCVFVALALAVETQRCSGNEVITSASASLFDGMTNDTFGYEFTVGSQNLNVNALGVWDSSFGVGLNDSHEVGLWDEFGGLLTSVTVPAGNTATLSPSGFWYVPISLPVTLSANTTYILGAKYPFSAPGIDTGIIHATITTDPEVTFGTARRGNTLTFTFPDNVVSVWDDGYFGPNMDYTVVPEPTAITMMGLGLLAFTLRRRFCL